MSWTEAALIYSKEFEDISPSDMIHPKTLMQNYLPSDLCGQI